jgi:hypothetical protein
MAKPSSRIWSYLAGVLLALALAFGLIGWLFATRQPAPRTDRAALTQRRSALDALATQWIRQHKLARDDQYVYTIDTAHLLIYAARRDNRSLYTMLRDRLVDRVVVDNPQKPFTRHFVAWRYWAGQGNRPLDASGTTEALRLAKGLWLGSKAYDRPDDQALAFDILRGYTRHETSDQGIWFIANYYNLQADHFATNSYTIDYDPDLLHAAAEVTGETPLKRVADRSQKLMEKALAPTGLIRQIIQPELKTLMPSKDGIFSPNNVEQVSNSAAVALASHRTVPQASRELLAFVEPRVGELHALYNASTGQATSKSRAGLETFAPLFRLAAARDHTRLMRPLLKKVMALSEPEKLKTTPKRSRAYNLGQALLAIQRAIQHRSDADDFLTLP